MELVGTASNNVSMELQAVVMKFNQSFTQRACAAVGATQTVQKKTLKTISADVRVSTTAEDM